MQLILDTHTVLWFITDDPKLNPNAKRLIENIENVCFVSIVSYWEIAIKFSLGRLQLAGELDNIFQIIQDSGFELLPITTSHILCLTTLPHYHNDPFDRMIIAQALSENLTVVGVDNQFPKYGVGIFWER